MKTKTLLLAFFGLAIVLSQANAAVLVNDGEIWNVADTVLGQVGTGGPFTMTFVSGSTTGSKTGDAFTTFCVQRNEYFQPPSDLKVVALGYETIETDTDYNLSGYAAWVFDQFTQNVGMGSLTVAQADLLQKAIWAGMTADPDADQVGDASQVNVAGSCEYANAALDLAVTFTSIGLPDLSVSQWKDLVSKGSILDTDTFGVVVLKMKKLNGANAQDFIGYEDTRAQIPEPASLMVWSVFGAVAAGAAARRKRRGWSEQTRNEIQRVIDRC